MRPMRELIVFVHGMVNFSHNRTKLDIGEKEAQERLIQEKLGFHYNFRGAFDDSRQFCISYGAQLNATEDRRSCGPKYCV